MNPIKKWWQRHRLIAENRRKADEINRQALADQRMDKLKKYAIEMRSEMESKGFTVLAGSYYPNTKDSIEFFALTPAGVMIRVIIGENGGTAIGVIK